jgi:hypothetical protein
VDFPFEEKSRSFQGSMQEIHRHRRAGLLLSIAEGGIKAKATKGDGLGLFIYMET